MVSVVMLIYNQDIRDVLPSVASVAYQENCEVELIVADDGSDDSLESPIGEFLDSHSFHRFTYVRSQSNRGIVDNLRAGIEAASGEIVKLLSPGDVLYSNDSLRSIEAFCCDNDVQIGFGRLRGYRVEGEKIIDFTYQAPTRPERYEDCALGNEALLKSQVLFTDWVPGCALFYRKDFITVYLNRLYDMGIKFAEDLTCPLITLDNIRIRFLNENVLWYEVGSGVTTSGEQWATKRLYLDHHRFYQALATDPGTPLLKLAKCLFTIREFIALHTPFYRLAQNLVRRRYVSAGELAASGRIPDRTFLKLCRSISGSNGKPPSLPFDVQS